MNDTRKGDWFCTASGRRVWVLDPRPEDICIEDVAHALSNICRFGGHSLRFYSVAEHSVLASAIAHELWAKRNPERPPPRGGLAALRLARRTLLHDAAEAYLGDVIRPLKIELHDYKAIERQWEAVVAQAFNLEPDPEADAIVKEADRIALVTEREDVGHPAWKQWGWKEDETGIGRLPQLGRVACLPPTLACGLFLDRYEWFQQRIAKEEYAQ